MTIQGENRRITEQCTSDKIRLAGKEDICAIREIWHNVFTSDETYLDIIFNNLYPLLDAFVYTINGEIVSAAFAIPITLVQKGGATTDYTTESSQIMESDSSSRFECRDKRKKGLNGRYLYGVATIKKARGRGLSRKIVRYIRDYYKSGREDFIITRPAEESLFPFYKAQGFSIPLYRRKTTLSLKQFKQSDGYTIPIEILSTSRDHAPDSKNINSNSTNLQEDITPEDLYSLRSGLCENIFEWDSHILECILKLTNVERGIIRYYPELRQYFIANYITTQALEADTELIIQENNFKSLKVLFSHIFTINFTMENSTASHSSEFNKTDSVTVIEPVSCNFEKFTGNLHKNIISSISEFALCMPLSEKISKETIQKSFFNFTME